MTSIRLCVNIDHVATLRQARGGSEPDPLAAALLCEACGADGITAHLREDRRHIQDADIAALRAHIRTPFNLEMACTSEMLEIAERLRPHQVTFVPERREEVTTEGGLDIAHAERALHDGVARLKRAGIRTSLFVDPTDDVGARCAAIGADAVELHTGAYANAQDRTAPLAALVASARDCARAGLGVHAGHGITGENVGALAAIAEVEEFNIGHHIVSRAVFDGLPAILRQMRDAMEGARSGRK